MLGEAVDNNPDGIVAVRQCEASNKVHRDVLPWVVGDRQGFENTVGGMAGALGPLAGVAISEVTLDVLPHLWPEVFFAEEVIGLCTTWIGPLPGVMVVLKQAGAKFIKGGGVEAVLVTKPAVLAGTVSQGDALALADTISEHLWHRTKDRVSFTTGC